MLRRGPASSLLHPYLHSLGMSPTRLEADAHIILCKHYILRDATDAIGALAHGLKLHVGYAALVTADTASVAHIFRISDSLWCCEIQRCESSRVSQQVRAGHWGKLIECSYNWIVRWQRRRVWASLTKRTLRTTILAISIGCGRRKVNWIRHGERVILELGRGWKSLKIHRSRKLLLRATWWSLASRG